jgi:hypothetical protein
VIQCKHCKVEKLESDMSIWAGKPSKVCIECKAKHPTGGAARAAANEGGGSAPKKSRSAARRKSSKRSTQPAADLEILLPAGTFFGCSARVTEEGYLQLTQQNDDAAPDNICLTRHEAKALFDKFGEWIVDPATQG